MRLEWRKGVCQWDYLQVFLLIFWQQPFLIIHSWQTGQSWDILLVGGSHMIELQLIISGIVRSSWCYVRKERRSCSSFDLRFHDNLNWVPWFLLTAITAINFRTTKLQLENLTLILDIFICTRNAIVNAPTTVLPRCGEVAFVLQMIHLWVIMASINTAQRRRTIYYFITEHVNWFSIFFRNFPIWNPILLWYS